MGLYTTSCKTCVFNSAAITPHKFVDCIYNRYEKYEEKGEVSEDKMSITRLCGACRDLEWGKKFRGQWDEQLFKELTQAYTLVIVDEEKGDVLERLKESLQEPQTVNPLKIILVYSSDYPLTKLNEFMRSYVKDKNIPFTITRIDAEDYERELIDYAVKNAVGHFYTIQQNGIRLNPHAFYMMYYYLEVLLEKVLVVHNVPSRFEKDYHGLTVSVLYHKHVGGNLNGKIEWKTHIQRDNTDEAWAIKAWPQIYSMCSDHKAKVLAEEGGEV